MHAKDEIRIRKLDMAIPVLLWLFLIICCLSFLFYMIRKNEIENNYDYYSAAKQNQFTVKSQIEGDIHLLNTIAAGFRGMDSEHARQLPEIIDRMNLSKEGMKIEYTRKLDWSRLDREDTYLTVMIRGEKNQPLGYLYAGNARDMLNQMLNTQTLAGVGICAVLDNKGYFIAANGNRDAIYWNSIRNKTYDMITNHQQTSSELDFTKNKHDYTVLIPLEYNDWYLLNVFPKSGLQGIHMEMAVGIGIMILISSGLFFVFFYKQYRTITANQKTLVNIAYTDSLTRSRNFHSFKKEAVRILRTADLKRYAVWYCDIKKFKFINDVLGYEEGDRILIEIAGLLQKCSGQNSLFCRVSADNFAGLYQYESRTELQNCFQKLIEDFRQKELSYNKRIATELCMGVYFLEEEDRNVSIDNIVNRANIAQKYTKNLPGNQFGIYNKEMRDKVVDESELESEMEGAIKRQEFRIFIQPKVSIQKNNEIVGGEVLVRWENPRRGTILPGQFISIMERDEKIILLDRYMFEKSCQWLHQYLKSGRKPINLAVNVSKVGILRDDFVDYYGSIKEKYEIPDGVMELEFTETVMLTDDTVFNGLVARLHEKGFICSLDDFGAGYSSLNLLKNLTIDIVKLDIMFFRKSNDIRRERIVISNIIRMAKELQIKTIAEGVEYTETVDFLRTAGCDIVQGYVFARPMPVESFEKLLKETVTLVPQDEYKAVNT
ncbi:EAL domain-containing protein [Clostridium boliviensis]|uniref:EAL domain-containing protein n=1 Tax=Clostridium boliviensis TaxID=318465 RepID=A0ABU4GMC4_9CLOT|nr:EAL domain-containing protein [Clostridium boliviensis]MDW2798759.1 EAL domain-containing protein [Clostridium boliviensis]